MNDSYFSFLNASKGQSGSCVMEGLNEGLLPQDEELSQIWVEVGEISKIVESDVPDSEILSQTLRRAVSCVVRQALLEKELRSLALVDDLTGLHNRRAFTALANQQFKVANRNNQKLVFFFADIDCFKSINDTYGHQEGDLAIRRAARALQQTFRNSDIVARLGGDEFAVIALEALSESEGGILRRLTSNLRELRGDESRYDVSLTVGIARYDPAESISLEALMEQADQSMYKKREMARRRGAVGRPGRD